MYKSIWSRTVLAALLSVVSSALYSQAITNDPRPVPRTADGHVSFAGTPQYPGNWNGPGPRGTLANPVGERAEGYPIHNLDINISDADVPFQPWARTLYEERIGGFHKDEPYTQCKPTGGPRLLLTPYGNEWIHLVDTQEILYLGTGGPHSWRRIYMDGRSHPTDLKPTRFGHSVGHWEGDTLVIDSVGYTTNFWLDRNGYPHTEQLHLVERVSRPSFDRLHYIVTVEDPGAYTDVWAGGYWIDWADGNEPFDYLCQENNLDPAKMTAW